MKFISVKLSYSNLIHKQFEEILKYLLFSIFIMYICIVINFLLKLFMMENKIFYKMFLLFLFVCMLSNIHSQNLIRFYQNTKCGYKDTLGNIIVVPTYIAGSEFSDGMALVVNNQNKRGFINAKGEEVIPLIYDDASIFFNGLARVTINKKNGFINKQAKAIIPFIYDFADDFHNGMARVCLKNKYGFINPTAKIIIPLIYDNARNLSEGLIAVKKGKWGYIDMTNKIKIPFQYDDAMNFNNGRSIILKENNYFVIDKNNKLIKEIPRRKEGEEEDEENEQRH